MKRKTNKPNAIKLFPIYMPAKILICDKIEESGVVLLKQEGFEVHEETTIDQSHLREVVLDYDAIIVRSRTKVTEEVIRAGKKLRVIARAGVGLDNIDLNEAKKKGIPVINTPDAPTTSVAELSVALILSILRKIPYSDQQLKKNQWIKKELIGRELRSQTIGVIGAGGRIGFETARILKEGFHSNVIGYDIIDVADKLKKIGVEPESSLTNLLKRSDIVTIHVPNLPSTHHLLNKDNIKQLKKGVILINTSRGDVIDQKALLNGLKSGRISGVGLDVYPNEPPKEEWETEIITLPKGITVCTCHIGAQTREAQEKAGIQAAKKIIDVLKEKT